MLPYRRGCNFVDYVGMFMRLSKCGHHHHARVELPMMSTLIETEI